MVTSCTISGNSCSENFSGIIFENVLSELGLNETKVEEIKDLLDESLDDHINEIVEQCMS